MMIKRYLAVLVALITLSSYSQIDRSRMPQPGPPPEINLEQPSTFVLNSGLQVMVVENKKLPRVSIQLTIDNAPYLEGDKAGVSNLTANLLGNGSKSISKDAFNEEVDFLGANVQFGAQSASAQCLSKYFPRILELLADAAIHPNFTQEEFEKEKAKLITAIKASENDVSSIAGRVQAALAYGRGHPYGEFATETTVNNVTLEDVQQFYADYFVPANAYLVVIGDVVFGDVEQLVTRYFTPWTKATPPSIEFSRPANVQYSQISFVDMPNAVQSEISIQHLVNLQMKDADYLPALLANRILGGGAQGRLEGHIREKKAFAYYARSSLGDDKYAPALFKAFTSVRNNVTDSAVVEMMNLLEEITAPTITEKELNNVKAEYTGAFVMALEKPETIARYALNIETEDLPQDFYATYLERINAITVAEVQNASQKYIEPDSVRIVVVGKGSDVINKLEKIQFKGKPIPLSYFDKNGVKTNKPIAGTPLPEGITVNTVIDAYFKAIGGSDKVRQVTSLQLVYQGSAMGSIIKIDEKRTSDKYAQTTYMNDTPMMGLVANGKELYMKQGANKVPIPPQMQEDLRKTLGVFPELGLLANKSAKVVGIEKIAEKEAYKIEIPGEVVQTTYYYDIETGLKVKEATTVSMNGQTQNQEVSLMDYRAVDGIKFPHVKKGSIGTELLESSLLKAVVNPEVSNADFE